MKKVFALLIAVSFVLASAPAFARQPGDGGFFTKFANDVLGGSGKSAKSDSTQKQASTSATQKKASGSTETKCPGK
ncbi:MAG: hypothetical protein ABH883_02335 [Candidatus Omnitrophota bacterium]